MPDITLSVTVEQAERIRKALRYKYAGVEEIDTSSMSDAELARYHILKELRNTVLDNEQSIAENQLLEELNKEF